MVAKKPAPDPVKPKAAPKVRRPVPAPENRKMTPKMKRFADNYLTPGTTITAAALKAGYPERSAHEQGQWCLNQPHVAKYIRIRQEKLQAKHDITLDKVIQEFAKIGFSNMSDYITSDADGRPRFKLVGEIGRDQMAVVTELTLDTRYEYEGRGDDRVQTATIDRIKFKLADKVNALNALGKHLGMFPKETGEDAGGSGVTVKVVVEGGLPPPGTPRPDKPAAGGDK